MIGGRSKFPFHFEDWTREDKRRFRAWWIKQLADSKAERPARTRYHEQCAARADAARRQLAV